VRGDTEEEEKRKGRRKKEEGRRKKEEGRRKKKEKLLTSFIHIIINGRINTHSRRCRKGHM
jgi:hypothetical protein